MNREWRRLGSDWKEEGNLFFYYFSVGKCFWIG